jgi:hypothetical protein
MELNLLKSASKKAIQSAQTLSQFFHVAGKGPKQTERIMDRLRAECRHIQEQRNAEQMSTTSHSALS